MARITAPSCLHTTLSSAQGEQQTRSGWGLFYSTLLGFDPDLIFQVEKARPGRGLLVSLGGKSLAGNAGL